MRARLVGEFEVEVELVLRREVAQAHTVGGKIAVARGDAAVVVLLIISVGAAAFVRQQLAIIGRPDSRPGLAGIACPAIVIAGRDDALMPPEIHEEQAAGIRGAELVKIPDCGHLATIEQPEAVSAALRGWLIAVAAAGRASG